MVKVLDFGLVKAIDSRLQFSLTLHESTLGTPQYMSPEAVKHPEQVDARSDLYSLGAVGFFLLAGRAPFEADTLAALLELEAKTPAPRLSEVVKTPVSSEFETLIFNCLAEDQATRPPQRIRLGPGVGGVRHRHPMGRQSSRRVVARSCAGDGIADARSDSGTDLGDFTTMPIEA